MANYSADAQLDFKVDYSSVIAASKALDALKASAGQMNVSLKSTTSAQTQATSAADKFLAKLTQTSATYGMTKVQALAYTAAQLGVAQTAAPMIAKMAQAQTQGNSLSSQLKQLSTDVDSLGSRLENAGSKGFAKLTAGISIAAAAAAAWKLATTADEVRMLGARVEVAAGSVDAGNDAMGRLVEMSKRSQTSVAANVDVFQRLNSSIKQMGGNQNDTLRITDLLGKAVKVSGSSAQEASASMLQFGQALGSGKLAGDELKSLMETSPYLMKQLAEGLGVPVGQLKAMGTAGKLTADVVVEALTKMSDKIDADFAKMPKTVSGAFQVMTDAAGRAALKFDDLTGLSGLLSGATQGLGSVFDELAKQFAGATNEGDKLGRNDAIKTWADRTKYALSYVADAADFVLRMFKQTGVAINGLVFSAIEAGSGRLQSAADNLKGTFAELQNIGNAKYSGASMRESWDMGEPTRRSDYDKSASKLTAPAQAGKKTGSKADPYRDALESANKLLTTQKEELDLGEDLNAAQKQMVAIQEKIKDGTLKVTDAQKNQLMSKLELASLYIKEKKDREDTAAGEKKWAEEQLKLTQDRLDITTRFQGFSDELLNSLQTQQNIYGLTTTQLRMQNAYRKVDVELQKELNELRKKGASPEELQAARDKAGDTKGRIGLVETDQTAKDSNGTGGLMKGFQDYAGTTKTMFETMEEVGSRTAGVLEGAFTNMAKNGKFSFKDMAKSILADLAAIAVKMAVSGLVKLAIGSFGGGVDATKASGGSVAAGQSIRVNEQGQEIFTPSVAGTITPASRMAAQSGNTTTITMGNIIVNGNTDQHALAEMQKRQEAQMRQLRREIDARSKAQIALQKRDGGLLGGT